MWRDKSPGVKILWLWTFGTAAVLVANVARTRIKDMDNFINAQQPPAAVDVDSSAADTPPSSDGVVIIGDDK